MAALYHEVSSKDPQAGAPPRIELCPECRQPVTDIEWNEAVNTSTSTRATLKTS